MSSSQNILDTAKSSSNLTRIGGSLFFAAGATFALFMVMQGLVAFKEDLKLEEENDFRFIDVVEDIKETPPQRRERKVEKPPEVEAPPPELDVPTVKLDGPQGIDLSINRSGSKGGLSLTGLDLGPTQDGDFLPLVRVTPTYPRRAQERGIEGYAVVELTVSADGTVNPDSITVIEAEPKGYFEREAKKAASKFKYKPKIVNGEPQAVSGVTYHFTFSFGDNQ